jgi:membrane dipeptidase
LTEKGKELVLEMNKMGLIIDLSESSYESQIQTINLSKSPIIFSNTNVFTLCNVSRNIRDEVIDLIPKNDGLIMIGLII